MTQATYPLVHNLLSTLTTENWHSISWSNLKGLKCLHSIPLDFTFLKAAARFWDAKDHVFRFQGQELCPLPKEFAAILDSTFPSTASLALPCLPDKYTIQLEQSLQLSPEETSACLSAPTQVPIPTLLECIKQRTPNSSSWNRLVVLVFLSQFLLTNPKGTFDCALLGIVADMEHGGNPFPTILAETLQGLDRISSKTNDRMSGSPLLLQVRLFLSSFFLSFFFYSDLSLLQIWLQEKLELLAPPTVPFDRYQPKHHKSRPLRRAASTFTDWMAMLCIIHDSNIRWMCPWWKITHITLETYASCVPIAGLHDATFYAPSRLCRQYGEKQRIVTQLPTLRGGLFPARFLDHVRHMWSCRKIQFNISDHGDRTTNDTYKAWVEQHKHPKRGNEEATCSQNKKAKK